MALVVKDRIKETSSTTGQSDLTLTGAVDGFRTFADIGNNNTTYYAIVDGNNFEVGLGTYSTSGPTLARTTVLQTSAGNTTKISCTGNQEVFVTQPADKAVFEDASGDTKITNNLLVGTDVGSYNTSDFDVFVSNADQGTTICLYDDNGAYNSALIKYDSNVLSLGLNNANSANTILTTSALNITNTGVGIGENNPDRLLHLTDTTNPKMRFTGNGNNGAENAYAEIEFENADDSGSALTVDAAIVVRSSESNGNGGQLCFHTGVEGSSERVRIDEVGNVGIGGSPVPSDSQYNTATLHLRQVGTISSTNKGSQIKFTTGSSGHTAGDGGFISWWGDNNFYFNNQEGGQFRFYSGGTEVANLNSNGDLVLPQTGVLAFNSTSDEYITATASNLYLGVDNGYHMHIDGANDHINFRLDNANVNGNLHYDSNDYFTLESSSYLSLQSNVSGTLRSLILTNTDFRPFFADTGTLNLGNSSGKWYDLHLAGTAYGAKGNFSSNSSNGQLTLENTASDYMMEFRRSGSSEWWLKASSSYFAIHENGSADHFTINSGGDIGMKCAPENNAGLEVNGGGNIDSSTANVFTGRSNGGNGNNRRFNLIALADGNSTYGGGMKIQTRNNSNTFQDSVFIAQDRNAYFYGSINAYSAGAVGLEVKGDGSGYTQGAIVLRSHPSSGSPEYRGQGVYLFNEGADENWYSGTVYNETTQHRWMVCHQSNSSMSYDTAQVTYCKFSVQKDGRIGVNNSSPDVTIHAGYNGQPNHYNAMRIGTNYPTNSYTGKIDWCDSSNITASIYTVYDGTRVHMGIGSLYNSGHNTADKFTFRGDGEFRAIGNVVAYYSDERLKDFHGKIEGALDKVKAINGYYYTENEKAKEFGFNKKEKQVGVSAQEVEKVLPEVVTNAPFDTDQMDQSRSGENYKTVEYEKLVPLLIEAIKEQQIQIDELKEKLANGN